MLPTTIEAIKAILNADPTVSVEDRGKIVVSIRNPEQIQGPEARILRRAEVGRRLGIPLRTVDYWAQQGRLRRVKLPGRRGAIGFVSSEVEAILNGGNKS